MYNEWYLASAPTIFARERAATAAEVSQALEVTQDLTLLSAELLVENPKIISTLRMATCPPVAVDRLIGLAQVNTNLVKAMEEGRLPQRSRRPVLLAESQKIIDVFIRLIDPTIFPWRSPLRTPDASERAKAATIVADRLCAAVSNPILRNAQEQRQLEAIGSWLRNRGYTEHEVAGTAFEMLPPGTFSFRLNVPVDAGGDEDETVNIPIDAVVMPRDASPGDFPLLIEAKSAGDFTNTNKRRKEEATKMRQLTETYGANIRFILFLCGYFGVKYLRYEANEGIDWVWEHRIDDLSLFGL